jgi:hypothetical protein
MNIPAARESCEFCKEPYEGTFVLGATHIRWNCEKCGELNVRKRPIAMTMGVQIWMKAYYELKVAKDASMAVILAAASVDCELSRLFIKSKRLGHHARLQAPLSQEDYEELLSEEAHNIKEKFKKVTKVWVPKGFQNFVNTTPKWRDAISKYLPEVRPHCFIKDTEEKVFWPRNAVLHAGKPATQAQGELSVKIARACLDILLDMENQASRTRSKAAWH